MTHEYDPDDATTGEPGYRPTPDEYAQDSPAPTPRRMRDGWTIADGYRPPTTNPDVPF